MLFDRWRQRVLPQGHIGATWRIRLNLCILRPTRVHNRNGKWIGLAVFAQLTTESVYTLQWALPIHENCPFPWKIWISHVTRDAFGPSLPSNRHHRSNGDCLEGKGWNYQVCSVQYCVQQFCTVRCTHNMNRPNSSRDWVLSHWAHFTVLRFIFVWCITVCCMHA